MIKHKVVALKDAARLLGSPEFMMEFVERPSHKPAIAVPLGLQQSQGLLRAEALVSLWGSARTGGWQQITSLGHGYYLERPAYVPAEGGMGFWVDGDEYVDKKLISAIDKEMRNRGFRVRFATEEEASFIGPALSYYKIRFSKRFVECGSFRVISRMGDKLMKFNIDTSALSNLQRPDTHSVTGGVVAVIMAE